MAKGKQSRVEEDIDEDEEIEEDDSEVVDRSLLSLEKKYSEQMRQIFPTKIDLPLLTLKAQIDAQIDLRPDFQRRDRWNNPKRSRFIESIIMNIPVPPVFLGEEEYGKYVVLDGRQRLTSAFKFLSNELRLEGLDVWKELNGLTYEEIKKKGFASTIERRFLPAVLLTRESSPEVKYEVFDRLNTGGVIAKPMEVRNAIFPGEFNKTLHKLSKDSTFRRLWGIPNSQDPVALEKNRYYREMMDLDLVLRFFVLRGASLEGMKFKDRMSDYMSQRNKDYKADPSLKVTDESRFIQAVKNASAVFGDAAFRKLDNAGEHGRRSAPYADAVMQALADHPTSVFTKPAIETVRDGFLKLVRDPAFAEAIGNGTNGESAIRTRIQQAQSVVAEALRKAKTPPARKPVKK